MEEKEFNIYWLVDIFTNIEIGINKQNIYEIPLWNYKKPISIKAILTFENGKYTGEIRGSYGDLTQEKINSLLRNNNPFSFDISEKFRFADYFLRAVSIIKKRLIEKGYVKTSEELDLRLKELDELREYDFKSKDNLTEEEQEELGLKRDNPEIIKIREEIEKEKQKYMAEFNIKNEDISYEKFNEKLEISISRIMKFPLSNGMLVNVKPDYDTPYFYKISMQNTNKTGNLLFNFNGIISKEHIISLIKKIKVLNIYDAKKFNGEEYNIELYLLNILKNPYYGLEEEEINKLDDESTCTFW